MRLRALMPVLLLTLGCAGIEYHTIDSDAEDRSVNGIRYYEAAPFLLVYSDGKGNVVSDVVFLPDLTKKRAANPYAKLASNQTTLTFVNGVFQQKETTVDETAVPRAVIEAARTAAEAALKAANRAMELPPGTLPPPHLYQIVPMHDTVVLVGGPAVAFNGAVAPPIRIVVKP